MTLNEQITLVARETGWALEYIREIPITQLNSLVSEILYQRSLEDYRHAYNSALIVCTLASNKTHIYNPEEIIGELPERRVMNENNLAKPTRIDKIILADGKEYELAPINANIYAELEDKFGKSTDELFDGKIRFKVYKALIYLRLHRKYPELTEEQVGDLLTTEAILKSKDIEK